MKRLFFTLTMIAATAATAATMATKDWVKTYVDEKTGIRKEINIQTTDESGAPGTLKFVFSAPTNAALICTQSNEPAVTNRTTWVKAGENIWVNNHEQLQVISGEVRRVKQLLGAITYHWVTNSPNDIYGIPMSESTNIVDMTFLTATVNGRTYTGRKDGDGAYHLHASQTNYLVFIESRVSDSRRADMLR